MYQRDPKIDALLKRDLDAEMKEMKRLLNGETEPQKAKPQEQANTPNPTSNDDWNLSWAEKPFTAEAEEALFEGFDEGGVLENV